MAGRNHTMTKVTVKVKHGKKRAKVMHVRKADSGGYSSTTEFEQPPFEYGRPELPERIPDHEAVHPDMADVQNHMATMFGEGGEPDEDDEADQGDNSEGQGTGE